MSFLIKFDKASELVKAGKFKKANKLCGSLIKLQPDNAQLLYLQGAVFHGLGEHKDACIWFKRSLEIEESNPEALNFLSDSYRLLAKFEDAEKCLKRIVELTPFDPNPLINLGHTLQELGRIDDAIDVFKKMIGFHHSSVEVYMTYGSLLMESKKYNEAALSYQKTIELEPDLLEAYKCLSDALYGAKNFKNIIPVLEKCIDFEPDNVEVINRLGEIFFNKMFDYTSALRCYSRSFEIDPDQSSIYRCLADCYSAIGLVDKAIVAYETCIELNAADKVACYRLNALTGITTKAPPLQYISELFDGYADNFETHLVDELGYIVPQLLRKEVDKIMIISSVKNFGSALDLGGGTGLVAAQLRSITKIIHNVDISKRMIEVSKQANRYDDYFLSDIISFLAGSNVGLPLYDLSVAADTLMYSGDLRPICAGVFKRLVPGGWFVFNIEKMFVGDFKIQSNGRYFHSENYIKDICSKLGFIAHRVTNCVARKENNEDVAGLLFCIQKPLL
jgi:predicted TPR repeat methyltransferase